MPFDPALPATGSPNSSAEMRAQLNGLKADIDAIPQGAQGEQGIQGAQGEVTTATMGDAIVSAIAGTSNKTNGVALLNLTVSVPPTQVEMQAIADKIDEMITALRRQAESLDYGGSPPLSASRLAEKGAGAGAPIPRRTRQGSPTTKRRRASAVQGLAIIGVLRAKMNERILAARRQAATGKGRACPRRRVWHEGHIEQSHSDYQLLDSGGFQKLERFGDIILARPCAQAVWQASKPNAWRMATATFSRESGNKWQGRERLPATWIIEVDGIAFQLSSTDFGHLGIFPEQREQWQCIAQDCAAFRTRHGRAARVLNLFAYSGGSTLAAARAGAEVCHVDASKGMVEWARKNAVLNALQDRPIRWIVDDVTKFLERELRRGQRYDLLILDPPSYGRGAKGEFFKMENDLPNLLSLLARLLSEEPIGVLISCHTPELTPISLHHLLQQAFGKNGALHHGEMLLHGDAGTLPVPSGSFCRWSRRRE